MSEEKQKIDNVIKDTPKKKGGCLQGCLTLIIIIVAFGAIVGACFGDEDENETTPAVAIVKEEPVKEKVIEGKKEESQEEVESNDEVVTKEEEQEDPSIGESAVNALKSNDFMKFVEEYKNLGTSKTAVWDNHLNGSVVTWTGTVVRAGTSQLFVYGGNDYKGQSWEELGNENKLFYTFVAKYKKGTTEEFKKLNTGDKVTVQGNLDSRGDFDLNFNWKIYEATIK